jgi:hypothetical protein
VPHIRLEIRLVLRLSHHLLGVFEKAHLLEAQPAADAVVRCLARRCLAIGDLLRNRIALLLDIHHCIIEV